MRKVLMIAALAATVTLGGCGSRLADGTAGPIIDPVTVANIQNTATQICGFVPTAATVASIVATFTGGGAIVDRISQVAAGICAAVTKKGAKRGGAKYRGVVIEGDFVRR